MQQYQVKAMGKSENKVVIDLMLVALMCYVQQCHEKCYILHCNLTISTTDTQREDIGKMAPIRVAY